MYPVHRTLDWGSYACTKHDYDLKIATATIAIKLIDLEVKEWSRWQWKLLLLKEGNYTLSLAFLHISPESADLNLMNRKGNIYRIMPYVRFSFNIDKWTWIESRLSNGNAPPLWVLGKSQLHQLIMFLGSEFELNYFSVV